MKEKILAFQQKIDALAISEKERQDLLQSLNDVSKDCIRLDFLNKQGERDKTVTITLLQNTVNELQKQKEYIDETNKQLIQQKELLQEQSQQLTQNLHALQLSYYELEQFAFIASHDLKTPLRNIAGYSQLLKRRYYGKIDGEADTFLDFIVNGTQQMSNIITHLLEYSRIDQHKDLSKVDLNRIVEVIKYNLRETIELNGATIEFDELPMLWVQKSSMIQLLTHLVDNAIKYRSDAQPHIVISSIVCEQNCGWTFEVSDNGTGLDEQYNDKAFLPFQRINSRNLPGSGMGLAICRKIVKLHGGDIWFKRNAKGGTTFYFTIPQLEKHSIPQKFDLVI